ncbi:integrin alpha-L-like [Carettochelys insculpta]|uniref:integrin alpha-L-like n=1 Tax=Carettochelys insculpta TaxID=44489 RepID=UPI003EBC5D24
MARTPCALHLLLRLLFVSPLNGPAPTLGYNIDSTHPKVLAPNASKNFGYQVLQSKDESLLVGAPGDQNTTGQLYWCNVKSDDCQAIALPDSAQMPHLGMSLASDSAGDQLMACGAGLNRTCDGNLYLSGACYLFKGDLKQPKEITPGYEKCLKGKVDLVFLFDGSNSMTTAQFNAIKDFMSDVIEKLRNSTIHFAAVQFSSEVKTEFDFNDYTRNPNPRKLLKKVQHMKSLTNTFRAIQYVTTKVFTPQRGAREGVRQVMIIVTDGDPTDQGNVQDAEQKKIVRYIIGIGNNFQKDKSEVLKQFASSPTSEFVKELDSVEKLKGLFSELQAKIYDIEGTSNRSSFHLELSSSGFSVDLSKGQVMLGTVGADNWAGGLIELHSDLTQETFISSPLAREEIKDAYMGYAVKSLWHQNRLFYAVGAPRHQHIGAIVLFRKDPESFNWTDTQSIKGVQIGSYFGAALCSVDVDGDGDTDMLLVGAPLYYEEQSGGRVHIYRWGQDELTSAGVLRGDAGNPLGRFGTAITALADLNGDGWADVAVGAPLESEERGAVYIYNGHKRELITRNSQRIEGSTISPGLKYFGQSIHGQMDLSEDGLTDIAVGALGEVVVLRARPVLTVVPTVQFSPKEIPVKQVTCAGGSSSQQGVQSNLTICFNTSQATTQYRAPLSAKLTYQLEVDDNRVMSRGLFGNGQRNMSGILNIMDGKPCIMEGIQIASCIKDYLTSIKISLSYALQEDDVSSALPHPVLNPLYTLSVTEIPFEKNCGVDGVCEADLRVHFRNSSQHVLVSPSEELKVEVELVNSGEDAYHTAVCLSQQPGLSFRKASVLESSVQTSLSCNGLEAPDAKVRDLCCNISHPIYREASQVVIQLLFDILSNRFWEDYLELQVSASSDNENKQTLTDNRHTRKIPVLYPVKIITNRLDGFTHYISFSSLHPENMTVQHLYQVKNLLPGSFPQPDVKAFVMVPQALPDGLSWKLQEIKTDRNMPCLPVSKSRTTNGTDAVSPCFRPTESCSPANVDFYACSLGPINTSSVITVTALLLAPRDIQRSSQSQFCTAVCLTFNTSKFLSQDNFTQSEITTKVELVHVMNYLPVYIGSGVGGLLLLILCIVVLYKCGFFKRNFKDKLDCEPAASNGAAPAEAGKEGEETGDGECKEALTDGAPAE